MKLSYRQKLFLYFGLLFTLFTIGIIIFDQIRERNEKTLSLEEKLEAYTDIIQSGLSESQDSIDLTVIRLQKLLPKDLRITIISQAGQVQYDNTIE